MSIDIKRGWYVLQHFADAFNPGDVATIGWAAWSTAPVTNLATRRIYVPYPGTVISVYLTALHAGGATDESSTVSLRLNNATDTAIDAVSDFSTNPVVGNATGLSVAVVAGDYLTLKWVTPTWVTNPTSVQWSGAILVEY